jgi:metal-dependent hydrolase (beta-lactamase superfamily II)
VVHILDRASEVTGEDVYYFSGGARLVHRPAGDTRVVARVLDERKVQVVSPSHCSLSHRVDRDFRDTLGERVQGSQLGRKVEVEFSK